MMLVLENVMKIESFQIFYWMQSFHDVHTVFLYCDGEWVFLHISLEQNWKNPHKQHKEQV